MYGTIVQHLVETSSLMAAGATVVTTSTGEDLVVPRSTGFVTTALIGEGASITESDPTLATVTLGAFKYANYFEISQELANDTPTNLLDFLARQAALSLGLGVDRLRRRSDQRRRLRQAPRAAPRRRHRCHRPGRHRHQPRHAGHRQPRHRRPVEPDRLASPSRTPPHPPPAFIMRNASDIIVRKLRDTTGQPVQGLGERGRILGYPSSSTRSCRRWRTPSSRIAFGDMSRYFVRIVNGVRFERSDEFRFQNDLVAFRCIVRLDGALIDTGSVKTFVNTT